MRLVKAVALSIVLLVMFVMGAVSQPASAEVSFNFFYSNLSQHGSWLVSAQYGRVWQPYDYQPGWNPYYDGHWAYSDLGWTWVSDYEWGACPYHYGTWVEDPEAGWVWMPGYVWAPSWVVFSSGPDYIGWAPVPPNYSLSVSIGPRDIRPSHFVFVASGHFMEPRVRGYALPPSRTTVIVNKTKIVNNITVQNNVVVNRGPDVRIVERASGRRVHVTPIEQVQQVSRGPRFSREEIRLDSRKRHDDLRVAEIRSADTPLPPEPRGGRRDDRSGDRKNVRGTDRGRTPNDPTTSSGGGAAERPSVQQAPQKTTPAEASTQMVTPQQERGKGRRVESFDTERPRMTNGSSGESGENGTDAQNPRRRAEPSNGTATSPQGNPHDAEHRAAPAASAAPATQPAAKKKAPKKDKEQGPAKQQR